MHRVIQTSISCGVRELVGLGDGTPRELIRHVAHVRHNRREAFSVVLFSDSERRGHGLGLREYIREHNLGNCRMTPAHLNPNTNRDIRVFMWHLPPTIPATLIPAVSQTTRQWDIEDTAHNPRVEYGA